MEKWAEERREMTELKARRKRAPRSEKPGKEGDKKEGKEESTHQGLELYIKCSLVEQLRSFPFLRPESSTEHGREEWSVGDAGREN